MLYFLVKIFTPTFDIEPFLSHFHPLSMKGCPYNHAIAEATYKIIKTEFVRKRTFESLEQLKYELADYVNWFNKRRIHSSLDCMSPSEYWEGNILKKVV